MPEEVLLKFAVTPVQPDVSETLKEATGPGMTLMFMVVSSEQAEVVVVRVTEYVPGVE